MNTATATATESLCQTSFPDGITAHFRPDTSDERVLREVITKAAYRRTTLGFDVRPGEVWLDLGANIGAFALYCKTKRATAVCYEPDPDCFELLSLNVPEFERHNVAITAQYDEWLAFWKGRSHDDHYRATAVPSRTLPRHPSGVLRNQHAACLLNRQFDGVKMDIEGSEGELLDNQLIPPCRKLVLEYHLSRDNSIEHLDRRLKYLRRRFRHVHYVPELDRLIAAGVPAKTYFDRLIYCFDPRAAETDDEQPDVDRSFARPAGADDEQAERLGWILALPDVGDIWPNGDDGDDARQMSLPIEM